jgi:hypothetical protein
MAQSPRPRGSRALGARERVGTATFRTAPMPSALAPQWAKAPRCLFGRRHLEYNCSPGDAGLQTRAEISHLHGVAPSALPERSQREHGAAALCFPRAAFGSGAAGRDRPEAACPPDCRPAAGEAGFFIAVQKLLTGTVSLGTDSLQGHSPRWLMARVVARVPFSDANER